MIISRLKSFGYAMNGLRIAYLEEMNFRIHLVIMIIVLLCGLYFSISYIEWALIILSIGTVICAELINSAIEKLCDHTTTEIHPTIKKVKDISAAAVLICATCSAAIGLIIFFPYLLELIR